MKNLKKTLAMVLVVATMLSILVVGAGAAFTDQADVDYAEAVEVLSAIKVLEGFEDGSFKPDEILTREQAAKIIAYAMIGNTAADTLVTGEAPFSDVAASRWSAGYITFCVQQGIINGYGDGRFGPADTLTGFQFAKMLLTALGYGKNDEFVGSNWTIEVAKLAIPLGIFDGNTEGASNAPCTREAAALYTFNAITGANTVNYSELLGIYYSGQNALVSENIVRTELTLGYPVYGLEKDPFVSAGRDGHYWMSNGVYITGFYSSDTVIGSDTTGTELYDLITKGEVGFVAQTDVDDDGDPNYTVYYNGHELATSASGAGTAAGGRWYDETAKTIKIGTTPYNIKRGMTVELIDTNDDGTKIDVINIVEKTITGMLTKAPLVKNGKVIVDGIGTYAVENCVGYENITPYSYHAFVTIDGITTFEKLESFKGTLAKSGTTLGVNYYVIGDNTYYKSELDGSTALLNDFAREQTYYLDPTGYIAVDTFDMSAWYSYYGLLLDKDAANFSAIGDRGAYAKVQMLKPDGTTEVYDVVNTTTGLPNKGLVDGLGKLNEETPEPDDYVNGRGIGDIYKYVLDADGRITSMSPSTYVATPFTVKNGSSVVTGLGAAGQYASSSTTFFYYNDTDPNNITYAAIKGVNNIAREQTADSGAYIEGSDGYLRAVLLEDLNVAGMVDVIYITSMDVTTGYENGKMFYSYPCYVDGKFYDGVTDQFKLAAAAQGEGAYYVTKRTDELYSATFIDNVVSYSLTNSDATFFIYKGEIYSITPNTEVYEVTFDLSGEITNVQPADMASASPSKLVYVTLLVFDTIGNDATVVFFAKGLPAPGPSSIIVSEGTTAATSLTGTPIDLLTGTGKFTGRSGTTGNLCVNITLGAVGEEGADMTATVYVCKEGSTSFEVLGTVTDLSVDHTLEDVAIGGSYDGIAKIKVVAQKPGVIDYIFNGSLEVSKY